MWSGLGEAFVQKHFAYCDSFSMRLQLQLITIFFFPTSSFQYLLSLTLWLSKLLLHFIIFYIFPLNRLTQQRRNYDLSKTILSVLNLYDWGCGSV